MWDSTLSSPPSRPLCVFTGTVAPNLPIPFTPLVCASRMHAPPSCWSAFPRKSLRCVPRYLGGLSCTMNTQSTSVTLHSVAVSCFQLIPPPRPVFHYISHWECCLLSGSISSPHPRPNPTCSSFGLISRTISLSLNSYPRVEIVALSSVAWVLQSIWFKKKTFKSVFYAPATVCPLYILPYLTFPQILCRRYCYCHLHFGNEVTKTQKGKVTCPR